MKNQPSKIHKSFSVVLKDINEEKREITTVGSQEKLDRDRDLVVINGIELKSYKQNPVVLWSHRSGDPPIGRATKVWKENDKLMFKIQFADMDTYSFADTIYKLIKGGYLSGFSIGFAPDWKQAVFDEKNGGYIFNKTDLLEISVVNVPANPHALVQSKSIQKALTDNIIDDVELNELKSYLEKVEEEKTEEDVEEKEDSITDNTLDSFHKWSTKIGEFDERLKKIESSIGKILEQKYMDTNVSIKSDNETYLDQILQELFDSSDTKSQPESNNDLKGGDDQIESLIDEYLGEN